MGRRKIFDGMARFETQVWKWGMYMGRSIVLAALQGAPAWNGAHAFIRDMDHPTRQRARRAPVFSLSLHLITLMTSFREDPSFRPVPQNQCLSHSYNSSALYVTCPLRPGWSLKIRDASVFTLSCGRVHAPWIIYQPAAMTGMLFNATGKVCPQNVKTANLRL